MAIANVNSVSNSGSSLGAISVTAGNLIVVGVRWNGSNISCTSVTDTAGNIYTRATGKIAVSNIAQSEVWYCQNCIGNASNVIASTFSGGATSVFMAAGQYSGVGTLGPLDIKVVASNAAAASTTTAAFTTTKTNELIINFSTVNNTTGTWTCTGYTNRVQDSTHTVVLFDNIVSSIQTGVTVSTSCTSGTAMISLIVSFADSQVMQIQPYGYGAVHQAAQSGSSINLPAFNAVAGCLVVVGVRWATGGVTVTSMSDTAGNTYIRINGVTGVGTVSAADLWYAPNILGNTSNIITINFSGAITSGFAACGQYLGCDTLPLDAKSTASNGAAVSCTSSTFSTAVANEVMVDFATVNTNPGYADPYTITGFDRRVLGDNGTAFLADKVVATIQTSISVSTSCTAGTAIASLVATFKVGGSGSGGGGIGGGGLNARYIVAG